MKWIFATNQQSIESPSGIWASLIEAAVVSAINNTTLEPCMVYDGEDIPFIRRLAQYGVSVLRHRATIFDFLKSYQEIDRPSDREYLQVASGAFLRADIPNLFPDDYALYTDCDVLFLRNPVLDDVRPHHFACAPEMTRGKYEDMNSGVMLMNLFSLRKTFANFKEFIISNYGSLVAFDQGAYRLYYKGRYEQLPDEFNWKPYWGYNPDATILHFHGPKPHVVRSMTHDKDFRTYEIYHRLYNQDRSNYEATLRLWDSHSRLEYANRIRNGKMTMNVTKSQSVPRLPGSLPTNWSFSADSNIEIIVLGYGTDSGIPYADFGFRGTPSHTYGLELAFERNMIIEAADGQAWEARVYLQHTSGEMPGDSFIAIKEYTANGKFVTGANYALKTLTKQPLKSQEQIALRTLAGGQATRFVNMTWYFVVSAGVFIDVSFRVGLPRLMRTGCPASGPFLPNDSRST